MLCFIFALVWGCTGPKEPKEPGATGEPDTKTGIGAGASKGAEITFSYNGVTGDAFEVDEKIPGNPIEIKLTLSKPLSSDLAILYGIPNNTSAKRESDYAIDITSAGDTDPPIGYTGIVGQGTASWGTVIKAGQTSITINPAFVVSDSIYEGPESLEVQFQTKGSTTKSVKFTIKDDDPAPSVFLSFKKDILDSPNQASVKESAGTVTIHAKLVGSASTSFPIRVPLTYSGTATIGEDYQMFGRFKPGTNSLKPDDCPLIINTDYPSALVIPPDTKEIDFSIQINDDFTTEGKTPETIIITAHTPSVLAQSTQCSHLVDNDAGVAQNINQRVLTVFIGDDENNGKLNPTGVTKCATDSHVSVECTPEVIAAYPQQDGVGKTVVPHLEVFGTTSCVLDTTTKLLWETKTEASASKPLHGVNHGYTWLDERSNINGGDPGGIGGLNSCTNSLSACDTKSFLNAVNREPFGNNGIGYCGFSDWRLPTIKELLSLLQHGTPGTTASGTSEPRIDQSFFRSTMAGAYWTSTPSAVFSGSAWVVDFSDGRVYLASKVDSTGTTFVRLVRNASQ